MARIYISSTYEDLKEERQAASDAIVASGHLPVGMEYYRASEDRPLDKCLADVRSCQGYVGIFAFRYGFVPKKRKRSITELEYLEAGKVGIPRLIFLVKEGARWPAKWVSNEPGLRELRAHLMEDKTVCFFETPDQLNSHVTGAIYENFKAGRQIPPLLPYLADRSDQEIELDLALKDWPFFKPLVVLVHGDERECHSRFLDRLKDVTLPRVLELDEHLNVQEYTLDWPTRIREMKRVHSLLQTDLGEKTRAGRNASLDQITQRVAEIPAPVLVSTQLLTEEFKEDGKKTLGSFCEFWEGWPSMQSRKHFFVVLTIKYQFKRTLGYWRRRQFKSRNQRIQQTLEEIGDDHPNIVVLPELSAVTQAEVERWARKEAQPFCKGRGLFAEIRDLFERWEAATKQDRIPMEDLADELWHILHKFNEA